MTVILKIKDVCDITALSKATIYREIKKGKFPAQLRLTERNVGWLKTDIQAWILSRKKVESSHSLEIWRGE